MIRREWRGWTTPANADTYERLLREEVFPGIAARRIAGLHGLEAWRRRDGEEVEFTTVMTFATREAVAEFAGGDPDRSVVPPRARAVLARFDEHAVHHDLAVVSELGPALPLP